MQEIVPGLFLGPISCAKDASYLATHGVTHRVTCLQDPLEPIAGVETLHVAIRDNNIEDIAPFLKGSTPFIAAALAAGGKVLVHCSSGASRSTTVVLAYLLAHSDMGLRDALRHVSARRACVLPATTFYATLQTLDAQRRVARALEYAPATAEDYNVQQLRAITGRPLVQCEEVFRQARGSVDDAVDALFALPNPGAEGAARELPVGDAAPAGAAPGEPVLVFTYGTLMRGFNNYKNLMGNATFLGVYQTDEWGLLR
jgi:serine/threonine/tyrosine-interacting protein